VIDPGDDVNYKAGLLIPGIYDDWPEAREDGFTEININDNTLRALLIEISNRLNRNGVDQGPMCSRTNDVKQSFEILVNEKNYVLTSHGLETRLQSGDEITILEDVIGFC
jgi:molybdopterin converting factor small subunit